MSLGLGQKTEGGKRSNLWDKKKVVPIISVMIPVFIPQCAEWICAGRRVLSDTGMKSAECSATFSYQREILIEPAWKCWYKYTIPRPFCTNNTSTEKNVTAWNIPRKIEWIEMGKNTLSRLKNHVELSSLSY